MCLSSLDRKMMPEKRVFSVYIPGVKTLYLHDPEQAAQLLIAGKTVALPSETVYGLAARADHAQAVAAIYAAKGRPANNPLIVHVSDIAAAEELADFDDEARRLAAAFWPGPLTLLLPVRAAGRTAPAVCAGQPRIALRCPNHPLFLQVLRRCGLPLAAPSANRSGKISPTCADDVRRELDGRIDAVLDGGPCAVGLESSVLGRDGAGAWRMLRAGVIDAAALAAHGVAVQEAAEAGGEVTPGSALSHYAPDCRVRLNADRVLPGEALLAFGPPLPGATAVFQLSETGDLHEAARNLFAGLHALNALQPTAIAVMPVPETGPGRAICDRLRRSATAF